VKISHLLLLAAAGALYWFVLRKQSVTVGASLASQGLAANVRLAPAPPVQSAAQIAAAQAAAQAAIARTQAAATVASASGPNKKASAAKGLFGAANKAVGMANTIAPLAGPYGPAIVTGAKVAGKALGVAKKLFKW